MKRKPPKYVKLAKPKAAKKYRLIDMDGIKITLDPGFHPHDYEFTEEVAEAIHKGWELCKDHPEQAVEAIPFLINRFPEVYELKNYLFAALEKLNRVEEASQLLEQTLKVHPDYVYAVLNKLDILLKKKEYDQFVQILGERPFSISRTFPNRTMFHAREAFFYNTLLLRFHAFEGNEKEASSCFKICELLYPDHPDLPDLERFTQYATLIRATRAMVEHNKILEERRKKRQANREAKNETVKEEKPKGDPNQLSLF